MATNDFTAQPTRERDALPTDERVKVAMQATVELKQLAELGLRDCLRDCDNIAVRGLFARIQQLGCSIMSSLSDNQHPVDEIRRDTWVTGDTQEAA